MTNMNHEVKSYDTLDFTDDFLFCKILTTDLELTRELLEIILNTRIRKVKIAESQKGMKLTPYGRGVRLDVYVPERLKNFLEFIRDRKPKDTFTERLDDHVQKARESRDWRLEYMTLEMKLREQYKLGREEGRKEGRSAGVLEMQKKSANAALDLGIPHATILTEFGIPESVLNAVLEERKSDKA